MAQDRIVAGSVTALLGPGAELTEVRMSGRTIFDAITFAIRDTKWGTIPGRCVEQVTTKTAGAVSVRQRWVYSAPGEPSTDRSHSALEVLLEFDIGTDTITTHSLVTVLEAILVNRIGWCLLHPLEQAGCPVKLRTPSGIHQSRFEEQVHPYQLFRDLTGMQVAVEPGLSVTADFGTSVYETEDHRNWTDAGWKTYTPPLSNPTPVRLSPGQTSEHDVIIRMLARRPLSRRHDPETLTVSVGTRHSGVFPRLGWGAATHASQPAADLVSGHGFLHVEIVDTVAGPARLDAAAEQALNYGVPLRVTLAAAPDSLASWVKRLTRVDPIEALCLVDPSTHTSDPAATTQLAHLLAGSGIAVGSGTRGYLAEYGRCLRNIHGSAFTQLSICPQIHHHDDRRIFDTLRAQPYLIEAVRARSGDLPLTVAPITLAPRMNIHRTAIDDYSPWTRSFPEDPRAQTVIGAAWTLGTIASLTGAGDLAMFHLGVGGGLLDAVGAPTFTGTLLADLATHVGAQLLECSVSDPRQLAALSIHDADRRSITVMIANLTMKPTRLTIDLPGGSHQEEFSPDEAYKILAIDATEAEL